MNSLPTVSLDQAQLNSSQLLVDSGVMASVTFFGQDADGQSLTYQLTDDSNSSVSIDAATGVVTFVPDSDMPITIGYET